MTAEAPGAPTSAGWRKRHPVMARAILYGLGAALFGGLLWGYLARQGIDRGDRLDYLSKRLDGLELVFLQDTSGKEMLKVLDAEFADPTLPAAMRQRAMRMRGISLANAGRRDLAEQAFTDADAIDAGPRQKGALLLEWAEARTRAGDPAGAQALLRRPEVVSDGPLGLLTQVTRAYAANQLGDVPGATKLLGDAIAALPTPLPPAPPDALGMREWLFPDAALQATEFYVRISKDVGPGPWKRLAALAPRDFAVQTAVARALDGQGLHTDAQAAWKAACACDPSKAAQLAGEDPALKALGQGAR